MSSRKHSNNNRIWNFIKGAAMVLISVIAFCAAFWVGSSFNNLDDYLEKLGIKQPSYDNASDVTTTYVYKGEDTVDSSESKGTVAGAESVLLPDSKESEVDTAGAGKDIDSTISSLYKQVDDNSDGAGTKASREEIGLTEEGIKKLCKAQSGNFAYEKLTETGKILYVEILAILQNHAKDVSISIVNDDAVNVVFDYVLKDHPEIFWADGYKCSKHSIAGVLTDITFSGNYLYDKAEVERRQAKINEYVNKCLANAPSSDDEYFAIKYIYEYIVEHTEYSRESPDNQNICSVFIDGKSVCNGYAKATQYLLNKLGIECTFVSGTVSGEGVADAKHAWNLVRCNNAYYYLDTTWGDASYHTAYGSFADATKVPSVNYDYLLVTTKEIERNHKISDILRVPECNSMTDNYFVREDEYFTSDDLTLVKDLFDRRYKDGSDNVTIKCANEEVYKSLFDKLITKSGVFDYLKKDTHEVSYTTFEESGRIIIWL